MTGVWLEHAPRSLELRVRGACVRRGGCVATAFAKATPNERRALQLARLEGGNAVPRQIDVWVGSGLVRLVRQKLRNGVVFTTFSAARQAGRDQTSAGRRGRRRELVTVTSADRSRFLPGRRAACRGRARTLRRGTANVRRASRCGRTGTGAAIHLQLTGRRLDRIREERLTRPRRRHGGNMAKIARRCVFFRAFPDGAGARGR